MENDLKIDLVAILSFYSFTNLNEIEILLPKILLTGKKKQVRGTILIAPEGFNGSISGKLQDLQLLVDEIIKLTNAKDINIKINYCDTQPFHKLKVKIKKEIIAMNIGKLDVQNLKGKYIEPIEWDNFVAQEDVIIIDTRNDYEVAIGTFKNAINPFTKTFKQFPDWVERNKELLAGKKIAMVCTGGIRCEKSTSFLRQVGFDDVYHLKGGILQYLEDTNNKNNLWQGECFVFDDRRAVTQDLTPAEGHWRTR